MHRPHEGSFKTELEGQGAVEVKYEVEQGGTVMLQNVLHGGEGLMSVLTKAELDDVLDALSQHLEDLEVRWMLMHRRAETQDDGRIRIWVWASGPCTFASVMLCFRALKEDFPAVHENACELAVVRGHMSLVFSAPPGWTIPDLYKEEMNAKTS